MFKSEPETCTTIVFKKKKCRKRVTLTLSLTKYMWDPEKKKNTIKK